MSGKAEDGERISEWRREEKEAREYIKLKLVPKGSF